MREGRDVFAQVRGGEGRDGEGEGRGGRGGLHLHRGLEGCVCTGEVRGGLIHRGETEWREDWFDFWGHHLSLIKPNSLCFKGPWAK